MVVFYTLPPADISYPYILINLNRPAPGLRYIRKHKDSIKSVIIDSGVEIFRDPQVYDYPRGHEHKLLSIYKKVRRLVKDTWAVIPDYPDDYRPAGLWAGGLTNIDRTVRNVEYYTQNYADVNFIIPVQGFNNSPSSILTSLSKYKKLGILKKYDYFAVANLCVSKRVKNIIKTLYLARWALPGRYIHAFGINTFAARKARYIINSFDSLAWTFPRSSGRPSCKNKASRIRYFAEYIMRYAGFLDLPEGYLTYLKTFI